MVQRASNKKSNTEHREEQQRPHMAQPNDDQGEQQQWCHDVKKAMQQQEGPWLVMCKEVVTTMKKQ